MTVRAKTTAALVISALPTALQGQVATDAAEAILVAAIDYQYELGPDAPYAIVIDSTASDPILVDLPARVGASVSSGDALVECEPPPPGLAGPRACTMPPDVRLVAYGDLAVSGDTATVHLGDRSLGGSGKVYVSAVWLELRRSETGVWAVSRVLLRAASQDFVMTTRPPSAPTAPRSTHAARRPNPEACRRLPVGGRRR